MREGIYEYNIEKMIENLNECSMSDRNKDLIQDFLDECFTQGISEHRVSKYLSTLKNIAISIELDFDDVDKRNIKKFISSLERSDKSDWTKHDYKVTLKKFYRWLYGDEPEITKWINATKKRKNPKIPDDMLTESEIKTLIDNAKNKRDKALIGLLWDIGGRIGEIGHLKIKDIKFDEYGGIVKVNGKTGFRRVRAVWSVDYLKQWINEHPDKDNNESPIWINLNKKNDSIEIMRYDAIRMRIKKIAKKAGIKKRIHPHLFRHSRCTYMANYLTEAQMNHYFGWVQGSNMPSIYVHLSGRDIDDAVLKANGYTKDGGSEYPKSDKIGDAKLDDEIDRLVKARVKEALENITWK